MDGMHDWRLGNSDWQVWLDQVVCSCLPFALTFHFYVVFIICRAQVSILGQIPTADPKGLPTNYSIKMQSSCLTSLLLYGCISICEIFVSLLECNQFISMSIITTILVGSCNLEQYSPIAPIRARLLAWPSKWIIAFDQYKHLKLIFLTYCDLVRILIRGSVVANQYESILCSSRISLISSNENRARTVRYLKIKSRTLGSPNIKCEHKCYYVQRFVSELKNDGEQ